MNELVRIKGTSGSFSGIELIKSIKVYQKLPKGELALIRTNDFPIDINMFLVKELTNGTQAADKQRVKLNVLNLSMINFYNICKEEFPHLYMTECSSWLGPDVTSGLNKFIEAVPDRFYRTEIYEPTYVKGRTLGFKYEIEIISFFESVIPYANSMGIDFNLTKVFKRQIEFRTEEDYEEFIDGWAKKLLGRTEDDNYDEFEDVKE